MDFGIERIYKVDPWKIIKDNFDPEKNLVDESIFSLANEYMGTRGMFEEGLSDDKSLDGNYIGGIYLKEKLSYIWKRKGFPSYENTMANTTNWISIQVEIDGDDFRMDTSNFAEFYRELDLKEGVLRRQLVFKTKTGCETVLKWERFISHADRHVGAVSIAVQPVNHNKTVKIQFLLDDTRENKLTKSKPKKGVQKEFDGDDCCLVMNIPTTGQYYIHRMLIENVSNAEVDKQQIEDDKKIGYEYSFSGEPGQEYRFNKIVSVWTSKDAGYPHGLIKKECASTEIDKDKEAEIVRFILEKSKENIEAYTKDGYNKLISDHIEKLSAMWDSLDIEIKGDELAQQGIRYCMLQMSNTYQGYDSYLNIGAKGLTGEIYFGRSFWDTESYCLPFYLFTNPNAARNLVEFRYNTLGEAKKNAEGFGYKGAKYPWQTLDGSEDCTYWEYAFMEVHLQAIVPYAIRMYTHVTGDTEYLVTKGIEVLLETARFWESRSSWDPNRNIYGIYRVTNADEWQMLVNNSFYTNFMAKKALEFTADTIDMMREEHPAALEAVFGKLDIRQEEVDKWKEIAEKMFLNYDEKYKIFVEDEMFLSLIPLSREELTREQDIPIEAKWCIEKFLMHDVLKQPDVVLSTFLFRNDFTLEEKENNYRFYEQRTLHGSSLSPCIHSIIGSEIGRYNQAYEYYLWASRLDLDDYNNNTYEGLHISAMAGTWTNIVYGFGGMVANGELLEFKPIIPDAWDSYSFKVVYRGRVIKISVDKETVSYQITKGESLNIKIYGETLEVDSRVKTLPISERFANRKKLEAVVFDLDGVITDTAKYHYKAWKQLADREGIIFDEVINERLKGVPRMDSLNIILEKSNREYSDQEKASMAKTKNDIYVEMLDSLTPNDILPGIPEFINELNQAGTKKALYSASRNTALILEKLNLQEKFEVIISGNDVRKAKPNPEGFLLAAQKLGVAPESCAVVEDAFAGIEGARAAKMKTMGIGQKLQLHNADYVLVSTKYLTYERVNYLF